MSLNRAYIDSSSYPEPFGPGCAIQRILYYAVARARSGGLRASGKKLPKLFNTCQYDSLLALMGLGFREQLNIPCTPNPSLSREVAELQSPRYLWAVLKILGPLWIPVILRHLIFRGTQNGTLILGATQYSNTPNF